MTDDEEFTNAFDGFGEDDKSTAQGAPAPTAKEPDAEEPKAAEKEETLPEAPASDEKAGEPKEEDPKPAPGTEEKETPAAPEAPESPEEPKPLTKDDVQEVVSNLLNNERSSSKELDNTTRDVLDAYYPDGLSNTLVDENSGKELRVPADVVEASGGRMSTEEATKWLMNEQYKLDNQVAKIKNDAKKIAETTLNFKRDAVTAVAKYEPLFKAYPHLQNKVYEKLMKQVKVDKDKNVILSSPDVAEYYDDYLEPYQQAYELGAQKAATNPPAPEAPEPPKPSLDDRLDEGGDGGTTTPDDPNDFAQQVKKELAI